MRLTIRLAVPLLIVLAALVAVLTPLATQLVEQWFRRDVELRSHLIFNSIDDALTGLLGNNARTEIGLLFERIARDERVLALGWCGETPQPVIANAAWPQALSCPVENLIDKPSFTIGQLTGGPLLVASFPVKSEAEVGRLIIVNDLSFIQSRGLTARLYMIGFLALVSVAAATVTLLTAHMTLRGWMRSIRGLFQDGAGPSDQSGKAADPHIAPMIAEIRQLIRDLDISRKTATSIRVDWSPQTLQSILETELPGSQILIVSNRQPYIHNYDDRGEIVVQRPASGVVTALEPIMRACGGTWIAHGSGSADKAVTDRRDHVSVPPDAPKYALRRLWLSEQEEEGYYYGLANSGLWPLCHITFVRPVFREPDWETYKAVNQRFADAVIQEATQPDPIILIQDYHFALAPRMIRRRLPNATIVTFWHIPWPNAEVYGICPWRAEILNGLLGSSIVGFHTQLHCHNFIEAADRFIECHIDREHSVVSVSGERTLIRPYPISIAWPPEALASQASVSICRRSVLDRYDLRPDTVLGVGVERFDFTKGIPDRFRAVEILLAKHPEWIGRFVFLQVAAPTRTKLPTYKEIQREAEEVANAVNTRFGTGTYKPIILSVAHHEPEQVFELFRAADLCLVSSLHDGMNLVAKEFVAARDDERGVLILSTFAGASHELMEALIVNPFDARATADMLDRALKMPVGEQTNRMRLMRSLVSENNIYYWAARMLLDAARIRKRQKLDASLALASARAFGDA